MFKIFNIILINIICENIKLIVFKCSVFIGGYNIVEDFFEKFLKFVIFEFCL